MKQVLDRKETEDKGKERDMCQGTPNQKLTREGKSINANQMNQRGGKREGWGGG